MNLELRNKNVVITGSTKGIGYAAAKLFLAEGANVMISGRNKKIVMNACQKLREEMKENVLSDQVEDYEYPNVYGMTVDLSKKGNAETFFEECLHIMGSIDILVSNAGIWPSDYVIDMEKESFEDTLYFNLEVPYILSRLCVRHMISFHKKGKIIFVTSQAAFHGSTTGHAHYAASKAGLTGYMISLARESAKYGINVNAIAPGIVRTSMTEAALQKNEEYYQKRIPIGRLAQPEDVAKGILFLASGMADYYTGITLDASGGMLMR